ncbi:hypothetical protein Misp01_07270 [Microtetraspora sp. NBRC 13810]|uniref:ABC transporter permease n=1 Tax=Microtetraspora sp. NBRC 13810 TaxID=3030990 RepID=UPI0024A46D4E|nr:ABC transporter permease [Microtetraspora sp. NBRC 13810]GLW05597.1 hypothetical protein Misp01_07270 [Microtetraspora sp. NBRC 13810]
MSTGVIHDIGYRRYEGARLGRRHAFTALVVHSLRGAFGLGRTARSKIVPFLLVIVMLLPAVVAIAVMALAQQRSIGYSNYVTLMQPVVMIFLAAQSPYLVAPDLRFRVLPLYLSRPVTVPDYVGAKVVAMIAAVLLLIATPITVTFVGELLVNMPGPPRTGEYLGALATSVIYAVLLAALSLAIASFTPRRGLGVASVIAFYLLASGVSTVLAGVFASLTDRATAGWMLLINPFFLVDAVQVWLFGSEPAAPFPYPGGAGGPVALLGVLGWVALGLLALAARYRKAASA